MGGVACEQVTNVVLLPPRAAAKAATKEAADDQAVVAAHPSLLLSVGLDNAVSDDESRLPLAWNTVAVCLLRVLAF